MKPVVCDTSVVVAYYVPEAFSERAERILRQHDQRYIASLALTETSSALRRKVHDRELPKAGAQAALDAFRRDLVTGVFRVIDVERRHYDHAAAQVWNTKERLRTLDALHLAVAELGGMPIVTGDAVMAKAAKELHVATIWAGA